MRNGAIFSGIFHLALALLIFFGLPIFNDPKPVEDQPIVLEMVQIAEKSNPRPNPVPTPAPKPTPQQEVKPTPTPPPPAPTPTPQPQVAEKAPTPTPAPPKPPEPKPEVAKPEPLPVPKPEVKKPEPPKPEPPKQQAQTPPPKKPDPPKKEPPKEDPIASILKNLTPAKPTTQPDPQARPQQQAAAQPAAPPSLDQVVTRSEQDAVKEKIRPCWYFDAGAIDAGKLIVTIRAQMAPDGSVLSAQVVPSSLSGAPGYARAAEAARRAVLNKQCQPLPLPAGKYNQWKELDLTFNPQEMMG